MFRVMYSYLVTFQTDMNLLINVNNAEYCAVLR